MPRGGHSRSAPRSDAGQDLIRRSATIAPGSRLPNDEWIEVIDLPACPIQPIGGGQPVDFGCQLVPAGLGRSQERTETLRLLPVGRELSKPVPPNGLDLRDAPLFEPFLFLGLLPAPPFLAPLSEGAGHMPRTSKTRERRAPPSHTFANISGLMVSI